MHYSFSIDVIYKLQTARERKERERARETKGGGERGQGVRRRKVVGEGG